MAMALGHGVEGCLVMRRWTQKALVGSSPVEHYSAGAARSEWAGDSR